jgi:lipopolysaccharide export system permease protein
LILKIHKKYLFNKFLKKFFTVSSIFLILVAIINIIEESGFLENSEANFHISFLLTFLNAPSLLYEMFPFIFLISTQLFFIEIYESNELETLKLYSFSNFDLLKIILTASLLISLFITIVFYNFSSLLKNEYLKIKNNFSSDDKYLAVITNNGLWIKDNLENGTVIINAEKIQENFLINSSITKFDETFKIYENIITQKIDVTKKDWILHNAIVTNLDNVSTGYEKSLHKSNFDIDRINNLFSDLSSLTFLGLVKLEEDYQKIGYSTDEIMIQKHKIYSNPFLLLSMTIIGTIIMIINKFKKQLLWNLFIGIFCSVLIYYITHFSSVLGENGKMPLILSVWFPIIFLMSLSLIGVIKLNEK